MNRQKLKKVVLLVLVLSFAVFLQMRSSATEITTQMEETAEDNSDEALDETPDKVGATEKEQAATVSETDKNESLASTEEESTSGNKTEEDSEKIKSDLNQLGEDALAKIPEAFSDETVKDTVYYNGLYYYMNVYLYDYQMAYLKKYAEYLEKKLAAYETMYSLGKSVQSDVKACQAELAFYKAQLKVLANEKTYCTIFIEENGLDFSDVKLEEIKTVYDNEYYRENYPEKDYMQMARYVTNFNNAVIYIDAKKVEIESIKMSIEMKEMLYKEGEIPELELLEEKALLEKAEYELAEYYVDMNTAYYSLEALD